VQRVQAVGLLQVVQPGRLELQRRQKEELELEREVLGGQVQVPFERVKEGVQLLQEVLVRQLMQPGRALLQREQVVPFMKNP
jgi:hypothetical protein